MWNRMGVTLMLHGNFLFRASPCYRGNLTSRGTPLLEGSWNSWSQCIFKVNKSSERTVRHAVNVYLPGERIPSPRGRNRITSIKDQNSKATAHQDDRESVKSETNGTTTSPGLFIKSSSSSNVFHEVMTEASNEQKRKLIVLEGQRLVEEAFRAGLKIHKLFIRNTIKEVPFRLAEFVERDNVPVSHVSDTVIKNWSKLTTPPGIVGVFHKPKPGEVEERLGTKTGMPVTVICDNIREPGNLGSILRSAAGAGCKRVLLSKGCVDPWDPKVLRSGCGAQFYMPVIMNFPLHSLPEYILADKGSWRSEREGRSADDGTIGSSNDIQSGGDGRQKMSSEESSSSFALFLADSNDTEMDGRKSLPIVSYADSHYEVFDNVYLVVGGETEGLSRDILQIAASLQTIHSSVGFQSSVARLHIPLLHNMESLNVSIAFSIIVYEMLRQFTPSSRQL